VTLLPCRTQAKCAVKFNEIVLSVASGVRRSPLRLRSSDLQTTDSGHARLKAMMFTKLMIDEQMLVSDFTRIASEAQSGHTLTSRLVADLVSESVSSPTCSPFRAHGGRAANPQLKLQLAQQALEPARMPAGFHAHPHRQAARSEDTGERLGHRNKPSSSMAKDLW
jgi:hypothetical protein